MGTTLAYVLRPLVISCLRQVRDYCDIKDVFQDRNSQLTATGCLAQLRSICTAAHGTPGHTAAGCEVVKGTGGSVQGGLHAVQLDLADQASIPAACDLIRLVAPRVDYLILNAGVSDCILAAIHTCSAC